MSETSSPASDKALELFESHRSLAARMATRYRSRSPAWVSYDDIFQECKIALLRASKGFNETRGVPFVSYATVIVSRAARQFIRHEYRQGFSGLGRSGAGGDYRLRACRVDVVELAQLATETHPLQVVWNEERWNQILKHLSHREQQVVKLRLFDELTNREVGEVLGCGPSRINFLWKSAISRIKYHAMHVVESF